MGKCTNRLSVSNLKSNHMRKLLLTSSFMTLLSTAIASESPKPEQIETRFDSGGENILVDEDPLEPFNRLIHFFNSGFDALIMKPLAIAYRLGLPEPVRDGIGNFFVNLHAPVSILNHLLQGEGARAGNSTVRFFVNTSLGFLGFVDTAHHMGHKAFETNFNETLGRWGVNTGPYLVLPFIGPSSFRHGVGMITDTFAQPETYYFRNHDHNDDRYGYGLIVVEQIHYRNTLLEALDDIANNSADPYTTLRSIYLQKQDFRLRELKEGSANALTSDPAEITDSPRP